MQIVTAEDAKNLADALSRALPDLPGREAIKDKVKRREVPEHQREKLRAVGLLGADETSYEVWRTDVPISPLEYFAGDDGKETRPARCPTPYWGNDMATVEERLKDASLRLIVLAACAFARTVEHLLIDQRSRDAISVAERSIDGLATAKEVTAAVKAAQKAAEAAYELKVVTKNSEPEAAAWAAKCAIWAAASPADGVRAAVKTAEWAAPTDTEEVWEAGWAHYQSILDCLLPSRIRITFPAHVKGLAVTIYENRDWSLMPILADALDEIGQTEMAVHCRQPIHAKGCHVLDSIMGRH